MRKKNILWLVIGGLYFSSTSFANEIGVGRDNDIPDSQPPAETETTTDESLLQAFLELFDIDAE